MSIKELIPPVVLRGIKVALRLYDGKEYVNYAEALKNCSDSAYQNEVLCNMIADKTIINNSELLKTPYIINPANTFLLSAINLYLLKYAKKEITILDFGGACGTHYFDIRRFIPGNIKLKWHVAETEQMVISAKAKGLENDELSFAGSITKIPSGIDLIYSSCALHYVPDPYGSISELINVNAGWILFNRMMFSENDRDFLTIQKSFLSANGPGKLPSGYTDRLVSYPHTTLSFKKFVDFFTERGYRLQWIFDEPSGSYDVKNEKITGKGILFIRNE